MTGNTLKFQIHKDRIVTSNQRLHWARKARLVAYLRNRSRLQARSGINDGTLTPYADDEKAVAWATIAYPTRRRADPNNIAPTTKAIVDGLVDAGLLTDDDSKHLEGPHHVRAEEPAPRGYYTIEIQLEKKEEQA